MRVTFAERAITAVMGPSGQGKSTFLWGYSTRLEKSALDLSGGQKQRLCIARALILEPEVLLCDEPTSSLDTAAAGVIEKLLVQLKKQCTILAVSHNPEQVGRIADRILMLRDGRLTQVPQGAVKYDACASPFHP
jgi:phosphate transport system ATP-binding protein